MPSKHLTKLVVSIVAVAVLTAVWVASASSSQTQERPSFSTCPHTALGEGEEARTDHNPRADALTVPMAPRELQLCRYYGFGGFEHQTPKTQARAGDLQGERILRNSIPVRSIAREFNRLRMLPRGLHTCPADEGAVLYAIFSYDGEPNVSVEVHLSGCTGAWNGRTKRGGYATPHLRHRLEKLAVAAA